MLTVSSLSNITAKLSIKTTYSFGQIFENTYPQQISFDFIRNSDEMKSLIAIHLRM